MPKKQKEGRPSRRQRAQAESRGEEPPSLVEFAAPAYWPTWLFLLWLRVAAALPFRWTIRLHKVIGRAAGSILAPRAKVARRNLELCFPESPPSEIDSLLRRHFEALGACLGETAAAWFADPRKLHRLLHVEGAQHLEEALQRGKGVLLVTGHFTPLEITGPLLKTLMPRLTFMFSERSNPLLDEFQARRRQRSAHEAFPSGNVRAMLRSLRENSVVWYAADQFHRGRHARLVPFFDEPAMTNTAISRLARLSGAAVVPFSYFRRSDDSGYVLRFEPPLEGFPSEDPVADTRRLVTRLEHAIRRAPEQYLWTHKRFRDRPPPLPDAYAKPKPSEPPASQSPSAAAQRRGGF